MELVKRIAISCLPGKLACSPGTTPISQLLMLLKKLLQKNYCLLKSCLPQLYLNKIITQLLFVFTPAANLVKDEFSCQSDELNSQPERDEFIYQQDEFICQWNEDFNCQKDEFSCQNLYESCIHSRILDYSIRVHQFLVEGIEGSHQTVADLSDMVSHMVYNRYI